MSATFRLPVCEHRQSHPADDCLACSHPSQQFAKCVSHAYCLTCPIITAKPSLLAKAKTFAGAVVRHAKDKGRRVPFEMAEARHAECRACDRYDAEKDSCLACGCKLKGVPLIGGKVEWASESCPVGKWGQFTNE